LALPACALVGLAFASMGFLATTYMRNWNDLDIVQTVTMPMLLFSATFFPLSAYGGWSWLVQVSPLYHGVALVRAANSGVWTASLVAHTAVLATLAVVSLVLASRRIERLLCR
jgi:lipooligosaccharide transport system permease protein